MSTPGHRHSAHGSTPLRVMLALASAAAGAALVLAPLSPQRIAVVTGLGLVCVGMVMLGSRVRSRLWVADVRCQ